jgi:hypothetical protein
VAELLLPLLLTLVWAVAQELKSKVAISANTVAW